MDGGHRGGVYCLGEDFAARWVLYMICMQHGGRWSLVMSDQ